MLPMIIDYKNISEEANVFLYPSSRKFYPNELEELHPKIKDFLLNWSDFKTAYIIKYNRFLIFFVENETQISTTLLDDLAMFIQQFERDYNITLLDKVNVCFKQGEYVQYQEMKRFRTLIKQKSISKKTIVFNNFIKSKYEFENEWEIPITESWLSHLIK
jgi:hypothetical protein